MKTTKKSNVNSRWKLGLMVSIGIVIFISGIFVIGRQQNLFGSTFTLKTVFTSVSGLQVGNNVRFNGINIGTVSDISLMNDTTVLVQMQIEKSKQEFIRKNSRCLISSEGLMGDKVVLISSGNTDFNVVKDNDLILSEPAVEMDEIVSSLKNTVENAEIITGEVAVLMYKVNNGKGTINRLLFDSALAKDMTATMENLKEGSESLNESMDAAKNSVLLRGAFRKQKKEEEKKAREEQEKKEKASEEQEKKEKQ